MRTSIALIVFVVSAQATPAFADDCAYAVTSSAPVLIIGARDETLFLEPSTGCNHQPTTHIVLRTGPDDPSPVSATVKVASDNKTLDLDIPLVPRDLVARAYKFQLVEIGAKDPFGTVDLPVEAITVESRLKVGYLDGNLDGLQSGLSDTENASPIAVTSEADDGVQVVNTAVIDLPDELPTAETDSAYWVVLDPSWKGDDPSTISSAATGGMEQVLRFAANADNAEAPYPLRRATAIPFQVMTRKRTPLRVVLELRQKTGPTHTETDAPWLSLDLQLAAEARPESLPLPVADYAEIKCDGHVIRGEGAMESADLTSHRCRLDLEAQSGNQKYGPQTLQITVSRDKAKPRTLVWDTSGGNKGDSVVLPTPDNDEEGEGAYTVEVTVNYSAPQAIYRSGVDTQLAKLDPAEQSQYRYSAILRPRGYECPDLQKLPSIFWVLRRLFDGDRCYVDIPLDLLALRFPAKVADLNSDDGNVADGNRYIQSSILRTGIEVVVEPWDYDRAHARIPVRFVAGLSLFDLGAGKFSPSLVTGLQLTLDRIGTGTASSAVTLGFMYELDLREPDRGSHFLFTSSINFLSLHAAQADQQH